MTRAGEPLGRKAEEDKDSNSIVIAAKIVRSDERVRTRVCFEGLHARARARARAHRDTDTDVRARTYEVTYERT